MTDRLSVISGDFNILKTFTRSMAGTCINIKTDVDCQRDNYPAEKIAISLVIICIYKSYMGKNIHLRMWQTNKTQDIAK